MTEGKLCRHNASFVVSLRKHHPQKKKGVGFCTPQCGRKARKLQNDIIASSRDETVF